MAAHGGRGSWDAARRDDAGEELLRRSDSVRGLSEGTDDPRESGDRAVLGCAPARVQQVVRKLQAPVNRPAGGRAALAPQPGRMGRGDAREGRSPVRQCGGVRRVRTGCRCVRGLVRRSFPGAVGGAVPVGQIVDDRLYACGVHRVLVERDHQPVLARAAQQGHADRQVRSHVERPVGEGSFTRFRAAPRLLPADDFVLERGEPVLRTVDEDTVTLALQQ